MVLASILSAGADIAWSTFWWAVVLASPLQGRRERGLSVLHYNSNMPIKNIVTGQKVAKEKLQRAKELRHDMTPAEKILWNEIRAKKLGVRFRRQQVIQGFVVDFYCHKAGLVVEVDGYNHDLQQEEDARREKALSALGLRVVRFKNENVLKNLSVVVQKIKQYLN